MPPLIPALDMQRARAGAIARELVARSPSDSIACIFAGGSLGRDEVWAAEIDGQLEVYSDLDIYVVTRAAENAAALASAAGDLSKRPPGIDGVRFLRAPEIGVYSASDLHAQPSRPGTVDLSTHHLLLYGDPSVAEDLPARDPAQIPGAEALYLLENRLLELDDAIDPRAAGGVRLGLIRAVKARLDVHAAHAIVARTFVSTVCARARRFESEPPATLDTAAREDIASAYRAAADPAAWFPGRELSVETAAALRALARAWRVLATIVFETGADTPGTMVARRCHAGQRRGNAREVIRLRRFTAMPMHRALAAALSLSQRSPRAALRLDALVRQLHAEGACGARELEAHRRHVERLTRQFGFTDGPLEKRVRDMHRVIS